MKRRFININTLVILLITLMTTNSCDFSNPMQDKETGEDLVLLLLDPNFFDTRMYIQFRDEATGEYIVEDELFVTIGGADADKIVDLNGKKETTYNTSSGLLELAIDPNYTPDEANPIEITLSAETEEYKWFSIPMIVTIASTGINDVIIDLIYEGDDEDDLFKSAYTTSENAPFTHSCIATPDEINYREFTTVQIVDGVK